MAGFMSLFEKLGFTSTSEDEMDTSARHRDDVDDEDEEDEEEEEGGRSGFGFPFSFSLFGRSKNQNDTDEEDEEEDENEEYDDPAYPENDRVYHGNQGNSGRVIDYKRTKARPDAAYADEMPGRHCEHIVVVRQLGDSRTIITHLHNGDSVILNLENIDPKDCGRVIDLLSGAAFALGGNIIKVSRLTYLLAPGSVTVVPPQNMPASNRYTL